MGARRMEATKEIKDLVVEREAAIEEQKLAREKERAAWRAKADRFDDRCQELLEPTGRHEVDETTGKRRDTTGSYNSSILEEGFVHGMDFFVNDTFSLRKKRQREALQDAMRLRMEDVMSKGRGEISAGKRVQGARTLADEACPVRNEVNKSLVEKIWDNDDRTKTTFRDRANQHMREAEAARAEAQRVMKSKERNRYNELHSAPPKTLHDIERDAKAIKNSNALTGVGLTERELQEKEHLLNTVQKRRRRSLRDYFNTYFRKKDRRRRIGRAASRASSVRSSGSRKSEGGTSSAGSISLMGQPFGSLANEKDTHVKGDQTRKEETLTEMKKDRLRPQALFHDSGPNKDDPMTQRAINETGDGAGHIGHVTLGEEKEREMERNKSILKKSYQDWANDHPDGKISSLQKKARDVIATRNAADLERKKEILTEFVGHDQLFNGGKKLVRTAEDAQVLREYLEEKKAENAAPSDPLTQNEEISQRLDDMTRKKKLAYTKQHCLEEQERRDLEQGGHHQASKGRGWWNFMTKRPGWRPKTGVVTSKVYCFLH